MTCGGAAVWSVAVVLAGDVNVAARVIVPFDDLRRAPGAPRGAARFDGHRPYARLPGLPGSGQYLITDNGEDNINNLHSCAA